MIMVVTANEVKTKGVSLFDKLFEKVDELVINVRGRNKYIVMPIERYEAIRAYELDKAYNEIKKDIADGRCRSVTPEEHFAEIKNG